MATGTKWRRHLNASDRAAKIMIEACVENGAEIEHLPEAPRFRYTPADFSITAFKGREDGAPSGRGSIPCGRGNRLKLKIWTPSRLDANPMYRWPMRGDDRELTDARKAWAEGRPDPLRKYLSKQAAERRAAQVERRAEPTIDDLFGEERAV